MKSETYKLAKTLGFMPVIPKKRWLEPLAQLSLRVPGDMISELDQVADDYGYSRSETVVHLLTWALDEHKKEKPAQKGKG